jgi:hypothetical protein
MGVIAAASKNSGSGGSTKVWPNSITDSVGNTWTQRLTALYDPGAASAGCEVSIYTAPITVAIGVNDSIVVNYDAAVSTSGRNATIYEFVPAAGTTYSYNTNGNTAGSATGSPTLTTSSLNSGDVVIGVACSEGTDTFVADSDTSNGSWSTQMTSTAGTGSTDASEATQYKITTGSGTQTYNPTLTSADVLLGYAVIRAAANQSATNGFFQW